ncbi:hypothetical protein VIBNISOn1_680005 [Vibrio nigripulchritudo SOn1]|uniref:Uncharacterized protein n=1 Tax=Vibrio nigripulchritudo SOn1 TaxID=1238450 RepID=A0AAV2VWZ4_9VIBR|nr:hypothetical protein VIBNISOn1_680005 [Vibrio nigripulchritudo SOn1]
MQRKTLLSLASNGTESGLHQKGMAWLDKRKAYRKTYMFLTFDFIVNYMVIIIIVRCV